MKVNPDLDNERKKCSFNVIELTHFLDGGIEKYRARKKREELFLSNPGFKDEIPIEYLSQENQYSESLKKARILMQIIKDQNQDYYSNYNERVGMPVDAAIMRKGIGNPFFVHLAVFPLTVMTQATPEQEKFWLKQINDQKVFGTYAQTELGHGTFVRGLETTATYLPETQQFELNSPTLTSYKWWPGGLGHTMNYAAVIAQLYTNGQCHGVHTFMVQLRDEKTYQPLPGITLGDVGHKFGFNAGNNGFMALNKVRIPRNHMLMKNSQVLPDGTYVKSKGSSKLMYGTMLHMRVGVVYNMIFHVAQALTIAVRYSAVRRQSEMKPGEREPQILDYQTQQYKLLPYVSYTYAFRFSSSWLEDFYQKFSANLNKGDIGQLADLHAMTCCLKAICTSDATEAIDRARLACGGHGYMTSSNLHPNYAVISAAQTFEGENTVLLLQTARALIKAWLRVQEQRPINSIMNYLIAEKVTVRFNDIESIVQGFKQVAAAKVAHCGELLQKGTASGLAPEIAWNSASVQLVEAAEAHCRAFMVERYVEALHTRMIELSPELRVVMQQLCELYCVYWTLRKRGDFLQHTSMNINDVTALEDWQSRLLAQLRPNAVGLVDAFDFRDEILDSTLGAWDGQVYQRLFDSAMKSPLNAKPVHDSFHASIAPMLKAKY